MSEEKAVKEPKMKKIKLPKVKKEKAPKADKAPKMKKQTGYSKFNSLQVKVSGLIIFSVIVASLLITFSMVSYTKNLLVDASYAKMTNVVNSYGALIDRAETDNNAKVLPTEDYTEFLDGLQVDGSPSSYCFIVDKNGLVKYHIDEKRIGMPNKNKVITEIIGQLSKGVKPENLCLEYEEDGKTWLASYYITSIKTVVVMCADSNELISPINALVTRAIILICVILVIGLALTFFMVRTFTKPLEQVIEIIRDTAQLKLVLPENMDKLCKRKDETGVMSRAVSEMSQSLQKVVAKIDLANDHIKNNMEKLENSSNQVHVFCTDNSATTQQLAASTQEVTEMANRMSGYVDDMRKQFQAITNETAKSNKASEEIAGRAKNMQHSTQEAIYKTQEMYQSIKDKTENALDGLKAVSQINELTSAIMEISDQTSLLSLNASIEAARAGEAGRGFSVVASEISNLANRSLETVGDIDKIIVDVNDAVAKITASMEETSAFLENHVLTDYDNFNHIGDQYYQDADTFKAGMDHISKRAEALNASIKEVEAAVERIHTSMDETTYGVTDIAEKTSNVVSATSDNYQMTNDTVDSVNELKDIVNSFQF